MEKKMFLFVLAIGLILSGCYGKCGPLADSVRKSNINQLKALLESGIDVNAEGDDKCRAIHVAVESFRPKIMKLLIQKGADVNAKDWSGQTPLIFLSWSEILEPKERVEVARLLLDAGADPDLIDNYGHTALMYATRKMDIMLIELLIEKGADVNIKVKGNTALKEAKRWLFRGPLISPERRKIVELLKKAGAEKLEARAKKNISNMRISIILVKTKTEAHRVLQKLGAGADFAELAGQYSIGSGKEEGGDMGFFAPGDLVEELNAVALGLKIGEYSGIVETSKGYFILMKTDEKSPSELVAAQTQEKLWKELNSDFGMLYEQGQYSEAAKVAEEALIVAEKTFGPDHPDVAASLNNLALVYEAQGKHAEAEPLYKRSLKIVEKDLGKDHPGVATTLNNLAAVYQAQGKLSEAEPLYKRALGIVEKALGKNHPHVATTCENMAELYRQIGEEDEAEKLEARARRIRSKR